MSNLKEELKNKLGGLDSDEEEEEKERLKKEKEKGTEVDKGFDYDPVPKKITHPMKDSSTKDPLASNIGRFLALLNFGIVIVGLVAIIFGYLKSS